MIRHTHVPDVFELLDTRPFIGKTVFIVGSGPNGAAVVDDIPKNAIVIAVNGAIRYDRPFDYWLVNDHRIILYDWWADWVSKSCNVFGHTLIQRIWQSIVRKSGRIVPKYSFKFLPGLPGELLWGILRGGASISGIALQFAYWGGCTKIVLCGVDMKGQGHFDGFVNNGCKWDRDLRCMNRLVRELRSAGCRVSTMSKTEITGLTEYRAVNRYGRL
jgi:hypothetical protein